MKTSNKPILWVASVLLLSTWLSAGADPGTPSADKRTPDEKGTGAKPEHYNKASGIVGMEVRNQRDEHLGHIKDLVVDLKTERVSYAVMTTASKAMPINEKLLAVPLNAFTASADGKHLVLNADKAKVEAATGFDSKDWPVVGSPSWGAEPFWQTDSRSTDSSRTAPDSTAPKQEK